MTKMLITLIGKDGSKHAEGMVDLSKVLDSHLVEHNKRIYYFKPGPNIGNHIFKECDQPYVITEF